MGLKHLIVDREIALGMRAIYRRIASYFSYYSLANQCYYCKFISANNDNWPNDLWKISSLRFKIQRAGACLAVNSMGFIMKKQRHASKSAQDASTISASKLLQPRPWQAKSKVPESQAPQPQDEQGTISKGFDLTTAQSFSIGGSSPSALVQPLQAKLTIGKPDDKYEQEADRVAKNVVQRIHSHPADPIQRDETIQRHPAHEDDELQMKPILRRQVVLGGGNVSPDLESSINRAKGSGQPLDPNLRQSMGQSMGADFSGVTIHQDRQADQLNRSIQAQAFTTGQDIFFRQGAYQPGSRSGQELIAHELTHVVQQNVDTVQAKSDPSPTAQLQQNRTGMSDQLKAGVEDLSGISMDDVKVHYNSPKPFEIGALAYTSGTDIHIGPKQEKHLAHEAWHVVQQKQGRVSANAQLKGFGLNDSQALEQEADVMGEKASTYSQRESTQHLQTKTIQNSIIQARLPQMSKDQIQGNLEVAREILLHSMRNISDSEMEAMGKALKDYFTTSQGDDITAELVTDVIRETQSVDTLHDAYQYLITYLGEEKHFTEESADDTAPGLQITQAILSKLPAIVSDITQLIGKPALLEDVFGVQDLGGVIAVYQQAAAGISEHITHQTSPVTLAGNKDHNKWVGVGGMTSFGSPTVQLGQGQTQQLAAGDLLGKGTLLHEFTHAKGNTKDHAYDLAGCAKLGPAKRVNNAETYVHGYLEHMGQHKDKHLYDAELSAGKRKVKKSGQLESETAQVRKKKFGEVKGLIAKVWNHTDDAYLAAQRIATGQLRLDPGIEQKIVEAATIPHKLVPDANNKQMVLALIEDRTVALNEVKKDLRTGIKSIDITDLKKWNAEEILTELIKDKLNLTFDEAGAWVYYMTDYINRIKFI